MPSGRHCMPSVIEHMHVPACLPWVECHDDQSSTPKARDLGDTFSSIFGVGRLYLPRAGKRWKAALGTGHSAVPLSNFTPLNIPSWRNRGNQGEQKGRPQSWN